MAVEDGSATFASGHRPLAGRLQGIRNGCALGWAWDPSGPDIAETVEILVDGDLLATSKAGELRANLRKRGLGSGQHGFRIPLPRELFDGKEHRLEARFQRTGEDIPGSPMHLRFDPKDLPKLDRPPYDGAPPNGKAMTLIGKDGWPFLCNTRTMDQLTGRLRLTDRQLRIYFEAFQARWDRFNELGIPYIFAAAPMKELIYREYLPGELELSSQRFPLDQLFDLFRGDPSVHMLDLRPVLSGAKRYEQVYYRTDHHLNWIGGYHVYRALLKDASRFVSQVRPRSIEAFDFIEVPDFRGDLANKKKMTVRNNKLVPCEPPYDDPKRYTERAMQVDPLCLMAKELPASDVPDAYNLSKTRRTRIFENPQAPDRTAVIIRDSFMEQVMPYLSEHFRRVVYVWVPNPPFTVIEAERPDVVLHLIAERFLIRSPLMPGWELDPPPSTDKRSHALASAVSGS